MIIQGNLGVPGYPLQTMANNVFGGYPGHHASGSPETFPAELLLSLFHYKTQILQHWLVGPHGIPQRWPTPRWLRQDPWNPVWRVFLCHLALHPIAISKKLSGTSRANQLSAGPEANRFELHALNDLERSERSWHHARDIPRPKWGG